MADASVPANTGWGDDANPHGRDPLLAEVTPEVPELSGTSASTPPVYSTAAVYEVCDLAGPPLLFPDGLLHPPRLSSVQV